MYGFSAAIWNLFFWCKFWPVVEICHGNSVNAYIFHPYIHLHYSWVCFLISLHLVHLHHLCIHIDAIWFGCCQELCCYYCNLFLYCHCSLIMHSYFNCIFDLYWVLLLLSWTNFAARIDHFDWHSAFMFCWVNGYTINLLPTVHSRTCFHSNFAYILSWQVYIRMFHSFQHPHSNSISRSASHGIV